MPRRPMPESIRPAGRTPRSAPRARASRAVLSFLSLASFVAVAVAPGLAAATSTVTLTFDHGAYDPDPPATGIHGPYDYLEAGARYAGFWFVDPGTPGGHEIVGHTHLFWDDTAGGFADKPHSWRDAMQGARITMEDGSPFSVVSIDYRVLAREPAPNHAYQFERLPWSYASDDVQLMLSTGATPDKPDFASFESQWTAFGIDDGSVFDLGGGDFDPDRTAADTPWRTLTVTGFEDVTELLIGHTGADVTIDSIVLRVGDGLVTPEPGTAALMAVGLVGLGIAGRGRRIA